MGLIILEIIEVTAWTFSLVAAVLIGRRARVLRALEERYVAQVILGNTQRESWVARADALRRADELNRAKLRCWRAPLWRWNPTEEDV